MSKRKTKTSLSFAPKISKKKKKTPKKMIKSFVKPEISKDFGIVIFESERPP
jgi:hypothetical protein